MIETEEIVGYTTPQTYLQRCEIRNRNDPSGRFSLAFALASWESTLPSGFLRSRLGSSPRVLIEGCASSENVAHLIRFLADQSIGYPEIHVIDLIDLDALGYADNRAHYHQANAAELDQLFASASLDLVIQDHLLNCAPIDQYDSILGEVKRMLRPDGLFFLHYTDPSLFPFQDARTSMISAQAVGTRYRLDATDEISLTRRTISERLIATDSGYSVVTLPLGNIEHFEHFERFSARLAALGFDMLSQRTVDIIDSEALNCRRNHCLLTPCHP